MSKETLVELRQQNTNTNTIANGDYVCTLGESISLKKGDQINVKQVFIDTLNQESNKIVIPPEHSKLTINVGLYLVDQDSTRELCNDKNIYYAPDAVGDDNAQPPNTPKAKALKSRPNGKPYYLASEDKHSGTATPMVTFKDIVVQDTRENVLYRNEDMQAYLQYQDADGNDQNYYFSVKKKVWRKSVTGSQTINLTSQSTEFYNVPPPLPIQVKKNAYGTGIHMRVNPNVVNKIGTGQKNWNRGGWKFLEVTGIDVVPQDSATYTPWTFPITITIGDPNQPTSYTKAAFARALTDKLSFASKALYISQDTYCDNVMMQSIVELNKRGRSSDNSQPGKMPVFVAEDCSDILQVRNTDPNYLFGASTFSVGYDQSIDVFSIDAIHSSIYTGGTKSVVPISHNGKKFILNKTGGIYISSCSWTELFTDEMQLPQSMFTTAEINTTVKEIGSLKDIHVYKMSLVDGINITGEIDTMDALVVKASNPYEEDPGGAAGSQTYDQAFGYQPPPDIEAKQQYKGILQTQQIRIVGGTKPPKTLDNAYYQLEIDANYNIEKFSNDCNSKKICAIVNKYYSTDNYTVGDSSMGLVYEHLQDEPMLLKNFRVRILNPDNSICDPLEVLNDNTVFLSIISNQV